VAHFPLDPFGEPIDDRVRIALGGTDVRIFNQYEVRHSFFSAPSSAAFRIGSGDLVRELAAIAPPRTAYEVRVRDIVQHSGRLDGYGPEDSSGASEVGLRGRDSLAPLADSYVVSDRSFSNATFVQLVEAALAAVGITDFTIFPSNAANRLAVSGAGAAASVAATTTTRTTTRGFVKVPFRPNTARTKMEALTLSDGDTEIVKAATQVAAPASKTKPLQAKAGDRWMDFVLKELRRAGLFLFAAFVENTFILCQPNTTQEPMYALYRQRGAPANSVNVLRASHRNDASRRYARYIVRGRAGGGPKKSGRPQLSGEVDDAEMLGYGYPASRAWVKVDPDAKNEKRATFLARRQMAEDARGGWTLAYTVKGHTAPIIGANPEERAVWSVDTMVRVRDDEYGINGNFWIGDVSLRGSNSGTTTELVLHKPEHLVFGDPEFA
jgi:prophage tail gpP-like protein